jgi:flagellar hook-associated protein 3 FlgL
MRVSTSLLHQRSLDLMQMQQQNLLRTQTQLATQQKLLSAADNPGDWAASMGMEQLLAQASRYQSNAQSAQHRLSLEETAIAEAMDVLAHARELGIQANSSTQSPETRAVIAQELDGLREQLLSIANRDDGQGRYLFAGARDDAAAPFAWTGSTASYGGDASPRLLPIGNSRSIAVGDAGSAVFMGLATGDGRVQVGADAANTGAMHLQQASVRSDSTYDGSEFSLRFVGGNVEVRDASDTLVETRAYTPGSALQVNGVELRFAGTPADGDRYRIEPSTQQDMFALLDKLAGIVSGAQDSTGDRAGAQTAMQQALSELEAAQGRLSSVRTSAGLRLGAAQDAEATLSAQTVEAQAAFSELRDVDVAEAASRLQRELLALQAAQASHAQIQGLSLFNYLR